MAAILVFFFDLLFCPYRQSYRLYIGHTSGGSRISRRGACTRWGGHGPPMWALFGENVCENGRIGCHRGGMHRARPPPPQIRQCILIYLFFAYIHKGYSATVTYFLKLMNIFLKFIYSFLLI